MRMKWVARFLIRDESRPRREDQKDPVATAAAGLIFKPNEIVTIFV